MVDWKNATNLSTTPFSSDKISQNTVVYNDI
nr:MAG TPA: hypothetical protein [Siphoviridae sp. ctdzB12]DAM49022.1 MAG TPA: hypothetical protein [Caudoviricetes sp.]DAQ38777.1 MAG TPA: hypothetical protein [Caudoviricetes sp.]